MERFCEEAESERWLQLLQTLLSVGRMGKEGRFTYQARARKADALCTFTRGRPRRPPPVYKQPYASLVPRSRPQDEAGEGGREKEEELPGSGGFVERIERDVLLTLVSNNSLKERDSGMMRL
jgi:hypothetical protein